MIESPIVERYIHMMEELARTCKPCSSCGLPLPNECLKVGIVCPECGHYSKM